MGFLNEFVEGISDDARYSIALVRPNKVIKKCRIREIWVEYFLSRIAVFLVTPACCKNCNRMDECSDEFTLQIIEKYNQHYPNSDTLCFF